MFRWIIDKVWDKINFPKVYREIKELGKKHGPRFFWAALIWECIEDIVFPSIAWLCGAPSLIPIFLVLHFEPVVYPIFFWAFKTWDRMQGREPWEPNRPAYSTHWRSVIKVIVFQMASLGWLSRVLPWKALIIFSALTSLFGFIHERIWHDANYGIKQNDDVEFKRTLSKTGTYVLVCVLSMYPLLKALDSNSLWADLLLSQVIIGLSYSVLETIWAKSLWGISQAEK